MIYNLFTQGKTLHPAEFSWLFTRPNLPAISQHVFVSLARYITTTEISFLRFEEQLIQNTHFSWQLEACVERLFGNSNDH